MCGELFKKKSQFYSLNADRQAKEQLFPFFMSLVRRRHPETKSGPLPAHEADALLINYRGGVYVGNYLMSRHAIKNYKIGIGVSIINIGQICLSNLHCLKRYKKNR